MADPQTIFGQADAAAVELAEALNDATFSLEVSATRTFVRRIEIGDVPAVGEAVGIQVIPTYEQTDSVGLSGQYDDLYGVTLVIQQQVAGDGETQVPLLLRLRSEIIELLCGTTLTTTAAVHGYARARVQSVRHGQEGLYDLARLESENVFYSALTIVYKAAALRRNQ